MFSLPPSQVTQRVYLYPFVLVLAIMFVQQAGAIEVVNFYVQAIFENAGYDMDPGRQRKRDEVYHILQCVISSSQ